MTVHDSPPDDRQRTEASQNPGSIRQQRIAKSTTVGGAVMAVFLAVYAVAQPILNERLGWQLPGIQQPAHPAADAALLYGILSDQGNDRFLSPAGLMYGPGSQEGHRLKHVERHTVDDPGRPGSHGVFDGGMAGALATIDKAYRRAKTGSQVSKQEADGRIIFTVDMGSRVGYVGGSDGRRRKNPLARRVRLVLERNRVITAYPM